MIISSHTVMIVSIQLKDRPSSRNRNYIFQSKKSDMNFENDFFSYITNANVITIQMRNVFFKSYVVFKNVKIDHLNDYAKKKCFFVDSKQRHLIVMSKKIDLKKIFTTKTMFQNEIIVYENESTMNKISKMIDTYLEFFKEILDTMQISFD